MGESTLNDLPTVSAVIIVSGRIVSSNKKYRPPVSDFFFKVSNYSAYFSEWIFHRLEEKIKFEINFCFWSGMKEEGGERDAPATRVRRVRIEASLWHYAEV